MHRFVALARTILIRALMKPLTVEEGFSHSSASNFASLLRNARASKPNIQSVDTMNLVVRYNANFRLAAYV